MTPMLTYALHHRVLPSETADQMGSGLLPVFATPSVVALMENAACQLIANIPAGRVGAIENEDETTVGTRIVIDHVKACRPGCMVTATAQLISVNGRRYEFKVIVTDENGNLLATAEHSRFIVSSKRFMARI